MQKGTNLSQGGDALEEDKEYDDPRKEKKKSKLPPHTAKFIQTIGDAKHIVTKTRQPPK